MLSCKLKLQAQESISELKKDILQQKLEYMYNRKTKAGDWTTATSTTAMVYCLNDFHASTIKIIL